MSSTTEHGRLELVIRTRAPGNLMTSPAIILLLYFGWVPFQQESYLIQKALGIVCILFAVLLVAGLLFRAHQRLELYEQAVLLYDIYPPREPDAIIPLEGLIAVHARRDTPHHYIFTFERRDEEPRRFAMNHVRSGDAGKVEALLSRIAASGISISREPEWWLPAGS